MISINYEWVRLHQSKDKSRSVATKFTKGESVYDKTIKNNDPKGWSVEGIKRYNALYNTVKKDRRTHKTFTLNWLAKRKVQLLDEVQNQNRKQPQQQAQIKLLDSEDDNSGNKSASANKKGANRTDTELSDIEND
jgi:hypothetical protein